MKKTLMLLPALAIGLAGCSMNSTSNDSMSVSPSPQTDEVMMDSSPASSPLMMDDQSGIDSTNGIMLGGALMTPDKDIIANARSANNFTTVVAAVEAAGLTSTLQGTTPYTVFAPTDAAFDKLPAGSVETLMKPENKTQLKNILTYHVVPGRYTSADLTNGMKLKTVQGQELTISQKNGKWMVNGLATVETADVVSSNGVTFVIDSVLMPK